MQSIQRWRSADLPWRLMTATSLAGLLTGNMLLAAPGVAAQGTQPACAAVAGALNAPRFVAVADDGTVYVSEAGNGGSEVLTPPPGAGGPPGTEDGPPPTRGTTGQVTRIAPGGARSVLVSGLPSYALGPAEVTGPAGITYAGGAV